MGVVVGIGQRGRQTVYTESANSTWGTIKDFRFLYICLKDVATCPLQLFLVLE